MVKLYGGQTASGPPCFGDPQLSLDINIYLAEIQANCLERFILKWAEVSKVLCL